MQAEDTVLTQVLVKITVFLIMLFSDISVHLIAGLDRKSLIRETS